ncbi:MAG: SUMF1/EgtB/PvdO family nonheme iron enzyme, partial [Pseudomonadota bacterium]
MKGAAPVYPEETPTTRLQVSSFEIQTHEVTNGQFAEFVEATGYVSDAEQGVIDGRVGAGSAVFTHPADETGQAQPWALVPDADWQHPTGAESAIDARDLYPVIHVSKRDAEAYAAWAGGRLPSEIEWEFAANLGLPDAEDPVSGAYGEDGPRANT